MEYFNNPKFILLIVGLVASFVYFFNRKKGGSGPVFAVPKEGGALQRLPQDEDGFISLVLTEKIQITHDTYIFRFSWPDPEMTFGLQIAGFVMFKANIDGKDEYRKYTPITDVSRKSFVDFVIKIYRANVHPKFPEGGKMTQYLEKLNVGDSMLMNGPKGKL